MDLKRLLRIWSVCMVFGSGCAYFSDVEPCPPGMNLVERESINVRVCVDRYEYTPGTEADRSLHKPLGNMNFFQCQLVCQRRGLRLLTNKEWLEACRGTDRRRCNIFRKHPLLRMRNGRRTWVFRGKDCMKPNNLWGVCMQDPKINRLSEGLARNGAFSDCVSQYGIFHLIGNLGEWVDNNHHRRGKYVGQFNGGLYSQRSSTCSYRTVAHGPRYHDYSVGCRCGREAN